jgi:hypothetical protein
LPIPHGRSRVYVDTSLPREHPPSNDVTADTAADSFDPPQLNEVQRRAVDALRDDGIAVLQFQELLGEELWQDAAAAIAPFAGETAKALGHAGGRPEIKDDVIVRQFGTKKKRSPTTPAFSLTDPLLRMAASELVLDIVNSYRGCWTTLFYVDNWFTVPYPAALERIASQRWHRDPEEEHLVKVFVYFSDVDEEAGPFEYVRGSASGSRYGDFWPWRRQSNYPPAGAVEAATAPEHRITLTGPAGTIIVCDTGGFHRGGFARTKPRILSTFTYVGRGDQKGKHKFKVDFAGQERTLPPQVRFALPCKQKRARTLEFYAALLLTFEPLLQVDPASVLP